MFKLLDSQKATQAAVIILRSANGKMSRQRLLALHYLADRESLRSTGWPILGSHIAAFDDGPAHIEMRRLLDDDAIAGWSWSDVLLQQGHKSKLLQESETARLSAHDVITLQTVANYRQEMSDEQLVGLMRSLPEWRANYRPGLQASIPYSDILSAVGFNAGDVAEIVGQIAEAWMEERLHRELGEAALESKPAGQRGLRP
jgi:hypothetical protein